MKTTADGIAVFVSRLDRVRREIARIIVGQQDVVDGVLTLLAGGHGTYPRPEAQLDRFLMKILVDYPSREELNRIVERRGSPWTGAPGCRIEGSRESDDGG